MKDSADFEAAKEEATKVTEKLQASLARCDLCEHPVVYVLCVPANPSLAVEVPSTR